MSTTAQRSLLLGAVVGVVAGWDVLIGAVLGTIGVAGVLLDVMTSSRTPLRRSGNVIYLPTPAKK